MELFFDCVWGIYMVCVIENFLIFGILLSLFLEFVCVFVMVKKVVVQVNWLLGVLIVEKVKVIGKVCDEIIDGKYYEYFCVDMI